MKKKNGKVCFLHSEENIKKDLPRTKASASRKLSKAEMDASIKQMIKEIEEKYSYEQCLLIVPSSDKISEHLYELLKGSGINGFAVWNLPINNLDYKRGKYDVEDFFNNVEALFSELTREFDEIVEIFVYGNVGSKEEKEYERA